MRSTFILLLSIGVQNVVGIYGGCMSYSTTIEPPGYLKVGISFLNGWKIGKGPCKNCTADDTRPFVTDRRKQATDLNPYVFGNWTIQTYESGHIAKVVDKTYEVNNISNNSVLIVNQNEGWELEVSLFSVNFPLPQNVFDFLYKGTIDNRLTLLPNISNIQFYARIDPRIRSDTYRPNTSPVVLVKPLYSLELNKSYTIHLTSIDNDGDAVRCSRALYLDEPGFDHFLRDLERKGLYSLDRMECSVKIKVDSKNFKEGDTFGASILVKDYSKSLISLHDQTTDNLNIHFPYKNILGRIVVFMLFTITGRTDPPEFIPPTPANNQEYIVYVGGDFQVDVYLKASTGRTISRIDIFREDGRAINHTGIQAASHINAKAVFTSVIWSSTENDIGHHIICVNAEDSQGRSTVDLQCYRIQVKENIFRPGSTNAVPLYPTFVNFPVSGYLTCKIDSYCTFPIFLSREITSIVSTSESMEMVNIRYSRELITNTSHIKAAQVTFLAKTPGLRQICLRGSDSMPFVQDCLFVTVERQDPCASEPCQNGGYCLAVDCDAQYLCSCHYPYTGRSCEKRIHICNQNPCQSNGTCIEIPSQPYFVCICPSSKSAKSWLCKDVQQISHATRSTTQSSSQQLNIGNIIG